MESTWESNEQRHDEELKKTSDDELEELRVSIEHVNESIKHINELQKTLNGYGTLSKVDEEDLTAFEQRYLRLRNWLLNKKEINVGLENVESIADKLHDVETLRKDSEQLKEVLTAWKSTNIPSDEKLKKRKDDWDLLDRQAKKTLDTIARVREQLKALQNDAKENYPELNSPAVYENPQVIDENAIESISSRLKYQYSEHKVTTFLSALNTMQIIALCGTPGTGKTTFARQMAKAIGAKFSLVEVQNNWTDSSDILGYYNPTNGTYQSTEFLKAIFEANDDYRVNKQKAALHIICLDEMNLARVEYYFATFLSLLQNDPEDRILHLLPPDIDKDPAEKIVKYKHFTLPPNIRFVGTMNKDDTVQFLTPKVIDRSIFIEFTSDDEANVNPDYNPTAQEDFYYPCSEFDLAGAAESESMYKKIKNCYPSANHRLEKYVDQMYQLALKLEIDQEDFIDMIILSKVLPSLTKQANIQIDELKLFDRSSRRFEIGKNKHKENHPYDQADDEWSYWE